MELLEKALAQFVAVATELVGDLRDIKAPASENKLGGRVIK